MYPSANFLNMPDTSTEYLYAYFEKALNRYLGNGSATIGMSTEVERTMTLIKNQDG